MGLAEEYLENPTKKIFEWKTVSARVKSRDLAIFNQRLRLFGYETLNELVGDFIVGKFPQITEDRQIDTLIRNNQSNNINTLLEGMHNRDFYEKADLEDILRYYITVKKLHPRTSRCLVSYFKRFRDTFFGDKVEELRGYSPSKKMWILEAFRKFGEYYHYKTGNDQCSDLVAKIIRRYGLNIGNSNHGRLYIVDNSFIDEKLRVLLEIQGHIGLTIKLGLFTGLREEEIIYIHNKEICNNLGGCKCEKLHVISKPNGMTIVMINWFRGHKKCYFTIMPSKIWQQFRSTPNFNNIDIQIAHKMTMKVSNLMYMYLRKLYYNIMCRVMKQHEADILAGRAKTVAAQHYILYELDKLTEDYIRAWETFKVNIFQ
jgi:intergrase/recombinase